MCISMCASTYEFKKKNSKFQNFYYRERNIDHGNGKHR